MKKGFLWLIVIVIIVLLGGYAYMSGEREVLEDDVAMEGDAMEFVDETTPPMSFFITSTNPGTGANYGGLAGADAHCQALAENAGAGDKTWHAYLSTEETDDAEQVDARDRIGTGPWHNAFGVLIANSVEDLHGEANFIDKQTGLDENGNMINGRGDTPNVHDILTGSDADGTLAMHDGDITCSNWTSESAEGSAMVGHHDRLGPDTLETATSWNSAHPSRGCSLENLNGTGGGGLLYCFAVNE